MFKLRKVAFVFLLIASFFSKEAAARGKTYSDLDEILKLNVDSLNALPKAKLRNIGFFNDGLVKFQKDSLWGFLNKNNEVIIEPKYKKVTQFSIFLQ